MDIVGAAHAGFQHAAAPDRDVPSFGGVVDGNGFAHTPHPSGLDVEYAAGVEGEGELGIAGMPDGFVEAEFGLQLFLELCVVVDIVVPERLLDHEQVELVELAEVVEFVDAVGRVGVAAQKDFRPAFADLFEYVEVPSGLDLDFDALVSRRELGCNLFQQLVDAVLDADGNAGGDFRTCSSEELP